MDKDYYEKIANMLKNYRGIGESESELYARLIEKSFFTIEDVKNILKMLKEKKVNSRAYQLVDTLKKEDLIEEVKKSNPKTYQPLHPRVLLNQLKEEHADCEDAFLIAEQARDSFILENDYEPPIFDSVNSEQMIISKIQEIIIKGYKIKYLFIKNEDYLLNLMKKCFKKIDVNHKQSYADIIVFEDKKGKSVSLIICEKQTTRGDIKREALFIHDSNFSTFISEKR